MKLITFFIKLKRNNSNYLLNINLNNIALITTSIDDGCVIFYSSASFNSEFLSVKFKNILDFTCSEEIEDSDIVKQINISLNQWKKINIEEMDI